MLVAAQAQLVVYPNGAVAPFDPNNAAATKEHFAALAEAGSVVNPYTTHAQDLAVPHLAAPLYYSGFGWVWITPPHYFIFRIIFSLESAQQSRRLLELTAW